MGGGNTFDRSGGRFRRFTPNVIHTRKSDLMHQEPILIDDDDDDYCVGDGIRSLLDAVTIDDEDAEDQNHNLYDAVSIDDDEIVDDDEVVFLSRMERIRDNDYRWGAAQGRSGSGHNTSKKPKKKYVAYEPRTNPLSNISHLEGHFITDEHLLRPGDVVELRQDHGAPFKCGDFLQIEEIFEDLDTSVVYLRGILYRRTKTLDGMLPKKLNEVYQVLQHNAEDDRSIKAQSLHDVAASQVTMRRCLRHTNAPFPENSFRTTEDAMIGQSDEIKKTFAQLTCRWKRIFSYRCANDLCTGYPHEKAIERITENECDEGFRLSDVKLRRFIPLVNTATSMVDLEPNDVTKILISNMSTPPADSTNHFADFFSGAGGVSIGARAAGFVVRYAVDHNADACATFRRNFPGTEVFEEDINHNLATRRQSNAHVRCCHFSTVCKTISTAYTVRGKNHDANEATLFCISDILAKATPMVATLEQTFGALGPSKTQIFNAFVSQFTAMNYSVRWAVHNLAEFGVPQARKRLVMMSSWWVQLRVVHRTPLLTFSSPGHPLPAFPSPTHGPGLKPLVTIADAFRPLRPGMPNHDPDSMRRCDRSAYNPCQLARGCITTSGGQNNWHHSGERDWTDREFACIQSFPLDHEFVGNRTSVICQVGNAVPPAFSTALYKSIRKTFDEVDQQDAEWDALAQQGALDNPIEVDDDYEMVDLE